MRKANWQKVAKSSATLLFALFCLYSLIIAPAALAEPTQIPEKSEEYERGIALNDDEKYDAARVFFEAGAEKGDPWCMNALGLYYLSGQGGLQKDDRLAFEFISKAADLNNPKAYYHLGRFYLNGIGVRKDTKKGAEFLAKAAESNDFDIVAHLGNDYLKGDNGVPQDAQKGLELLIKAAEENNFLAYIVLDSLDNGIDIPEETQKRIDNLIKREDKPDDSEDQEDPSLLALIGMLVLTEENSSPEKTREGIELLTKAANLDDPEALRFLGVSYLSGEHGLEEDPEKGIELLTKAANLYDPEALYFLGLVYFNGAYGLLKDTKKGMEFVTKAANLDEPDALNDLGSSYLNGDYGLSKDAKKGIELITKAANLNSALANYNLGKIYSEGAYVDRDYEKALAYYKMAKYLGNEDADEEISRLEHPSDLNVEPEDLVNAYLENVAAADWNYKKKTVRIHGTVSGVGRDDEDNTYITFSTMGVVRTVAKKGFKWLGYVRYHGIGVSVPGEEFDRPNVKCFFDKDHTLEVVALTDGTKITVQGEVKGFIDGSVVIEHCQIAQ